MNPKITPDRWLVPSEPVANALTTRWLERTGSGLMRLRLESKHVETVVPGDLPQRVKELTDEGWPCVRLVFEDRAAMTPALLKELEPYGDRVRLHVYRDDPWAVVDTLAMPEDEILTGGEKTAGAIAGTLSDMVSRDWASRYAAAVMAWIGEQASRVDEEAEVQELGEAAETDWLQELEQAVDAELAAMEQPTAADSTADSSAARALAAVPGQWVTVLPSRRTTGQDGRFEWAAAGNEAFAEGAKAAAPLGRVLKLVGLLSGDAKWPIEVTIELGSEPGREGLVRLVTPDGLKAKLGEVAIGLADHEPLVVLGGTALTWRDAGAGLGMAVGYFATDAQMLEVLHQTADIQVQVLLN